MEACALLEEGVIYQSLFLSIFYHYICLRLTAMFEVCLYSESRPVVGGL